MVSVHCADDMPEIERLRARVAELEARSAKLRAARERVAPLETVDCHCCHRVRPGYPGFDRCAECAESLGEDQIAAMFREARERVAELEAAAAQRAEDDAREREVDELRGENADLRRALEAVRTSHPGDYVVTYAHPNEALRAEVQALRALVASLRADVRAISDSIDADAARASAEARRVSGYARAAALTKERRTEIARNAGRARWRKVRDVLDDSQPMEAPPCD